MPVPIRVIELQELARLLYAWRTSSNDKFFDCVHLHCTDTPDHASWRGLASVEAMRRYHMEKGWSDIAQHLTIDPFGVLWSGRPFHKAPASATGFNSGRQTPFMIEMVGRFDTFARNGRAADVLDGRQLRAVADVVCVLGVAIEGIGPFAPDTGGRRNGRSPRPWRQWLIPHAWLDDRGKTCPGNALWSPGTSKRVAGRPNGGDPDGTWNDPLPRQLDEIWNSVGTAPEGGPAVQWSDRLLIGVPVAHQLKALQSDPLVARSRSEALTVDEGGPAERFSDAQLIDLYAEEALSPARGSSGPVLAQSVNRLRAHYVNIENGLFSSSGVARTRQEDVDDIILNGGFTDYLKNRDSKRPARLLLWAHGGLVGEKDALSHVAGRADYWLANDVYPIYFIWETGPGETFAQHLAEMFARLRRPAARGPRDLLLDRPIEKLLEKPGSYLWNRMKRSATRAASETVEYGERGAIHYFCERLLRFLISTDQSVELHAVGHSAGSIFLAELLGAWRSLHARDLRSGADGPPIRFSTWNLLAPAIRMDKYAKDIRQHVSGVAQEGNAWIDRVHLFTMDDRRERDDHCAKVYGKSLLYLISNAFEGRRKTPILGMQRMHDASAQGYLAPLMGADDALRIHLSSDANDAQGITRSTSHGGFDDDPFTLDSIVRIIHGALPNGLPLDGNGTFTPPPPAVMDRAARHVPGRSDASFDRAGTDDAMFRYWLQARLPDQAESASAGSLASPGSGIHSSVVAMASVEQDALRRRALCIGINRYASAPLNCCVADARRWASFLATQGFEVELLLDEQATLAKIKRGLELLVDNALPGDALAFQFAGHGTQIEDYDGDEADGFDEAFVPYDASVSGLLVDDDFHAIAARLPARTSLTLFMDCCHSGTNSRFSPPVRLFGGEARVRYMPPTREIIEAHKRRCMRERGLRSVMSRNPGEGPPPARTLPRVVHFAACLDHQYAYENAGHGDFTRVTCGLLEGGSTRDFTIAAIGERVQRGFAGNPRQTPQLLLDISSSAGAAPLFALL